MSLVRLQKEIYAWAQSKGWWEKERNIGELLMLMVSELSEAMEEWRHDRMETWYSDSGSSVSPDKPEGFGIELADVIIRVLDLAEHLEFNMDELVKIKMEHNETRDYRHGGLRA